VPAKETGRNAQFTGKFWRLALARRGSVGGGGRRRCDGAPCLRTLGTYGTLGPPLLPDRFRGTHGEQVASERRTDVIHLARFEMGQL
jgi:hypothetical protein